MADVFTKAKRSEVMSRIRSRGNKDTELTLAKLMRRHGITRWKRHNQVRIADCGTRNAEQGRQTRGEQFIPRSALLPCVLTSSSANLARWFSWTAVSGTAARSIASMRNGWREVLLSTIQLRQDAGFGGQVARSGGASWLGTGSETGWWIVCCAAPVGACYGFGSTSCRNAECGRLNAERHHWCGGFGRRL